MTFKVFSQLAYRPLLVDLTIEEGSRLKVIYGSRHGFHAIDLDTSNQIDIYLPCQVSLRCPSPSLPCLSLASLISVHRVRRASRNHRSSEQQWNATASLLQQYGATWLGCFRSVSSRSRRRRLL